ncbi:MAG: class I SAM-dependent methyltransferase [Candidatus Marinimicrobia bacterium]|nr:class I SAM-dependent methyltransferase [Candidatus Neomarinimicrobiota bacterium]
MVNWQTKWNERYDTDEFVYGMEPNQFLVEAEPSFTGKKILCVADGEGRNGVWLANKGYDVTSIDYAQSGIDKISRYADTQGVSLNLKCTDLFEHNLSKDYYDGIVIIYSHFDEKDSTILFKKYKISLRPSGLIIFECFSKNQIENKSGGPKNIDLLYNLDFIKSSFSDMEIIQCKENVIVLEEGPLHQGKADVIRLIAKKR